MSGLSNQHTFDSYLSRALRERLASPRPLVEPECWARAGVVLLSDIQGFTSLIEGYAARGKAGLEEITWRLNAYVADVVEIVEGCGGDVLSIAGDAFLCHWLAAEPGDVATAILRAAEAGLAIQRKIQGAVDGEGRGFPTRVGISAGEVIIAHVGGVEGRWELVASGKALTEAAAAERAAKPGGVLVSPRAWREIAHACDGLETSEGVELNRIVHALAPLQQHPQSGVENEALLRPFVPPAVLSRLVAQDAEWLAESRAVTVVLCAVPGLKTTEPSELARVHECVRAAQEIVSRYEGTVRADIDDKGVLLLAVFGLPPRAHEDDAVRAVLMAGDLQRSISKLQPGIGVGVATGRALCGAFGNDTRRDYMVRGEVINLAARLMHAQPDTVLCDAPTQQATRGRIAFQPLEPIRVRGRAEPVAVFRPEGRAASSREADTGIIGRERELGVIAEVLALARTGEHGGVTILEAEAGLGKSKLAAAAARQARDAGLRVLIAAADAIEQSTAYFAWRSVFSGLLDVAPDENVATVQARALERFGVLPDVERLFPLLSAVLPVQIPDSALTAEMTGDVRADNTRRILQQILQHAASAQPTLLVVEDAHWLDSASWGVLLAVVQGVRPLTVLVATRPPGSPVPVDFANLARAAGEHHLRLDALTGDETRQLIQQRLGVSEVPPRLASFIEQRVAGNPFFCEELLQAMRDSGVVHVRNGACTVGNLDAVDLPTTVEGVIISRLDRLTAGEQLSLKVASVIGRVFRERMVKDTHPVETERGVVHDHLERLTTVDLTVLEAPEPDLAYMFKHVITRDVTYESMPLSQRQPMHHAVATWYEHTYADDLTPYSALLAYHWARAVVPDKTVHYLEKAGEQALYSGAFREAVVFLTQAMEFVEQGVVSVAPSRRALWEKGLGRAQYYLGNLHGSRVHNERAVAVLHQPVPSTDARAAAGALGAVVRQIGHRLFPNRYLGRRASEKVLLDEAVECYKILGQAYYLEGETPLKLLYLTVTGLNVGEAAGSSAPLARVISNASTLSYLIGLPKQGEWYGQRAIEMAEREGLSAKAYVWSISALALAQTGRWAAAREANDKALAYTRELGDFGLEAEVWTVRTSFSVCEGAFASAAEGWKRQRELAERHDNPQLRCWSLLDEADTCLGTGDVEGAARALEAALLIPTAATDSGTPLDKSRTEAMTRLRQGRDEEAARAADAVFEPLSRKAPTGYQWADDFCEAVEVYLSLLTGGGAYAQANRAQLEKRASAGVKLATKFARIFRHVAPRSRALGGQLLAWQGKVDPGRREIGHAIELASELNLPFERARAQLALARLTSGADRAREIDNAATIFHQLGATHYLNEAMKLR
jgi:class 3 adenylate cyclase/tetratricopeptide (TPR) repeat protein